LDLDNLTHSLFGATLGRTPLGRAGRGITATLLIASNAPDIDIVATAGGATKYLEWHRGMTHGPLGLPILAVLSAAIVHVGRRFLRTRFAEGRLVGPRSPDKDAPFHMLVAAAAVGIVFHVLMDLPTSYGTRLLSPFSWRWYALDWMPIIDIYLLIVLCSGLFLGRLSVEARRRNAAIVLTFVAAIYGVRAFMHHQALDLAPRLFGPTLPPRCDPPRDTAALVDSWPVPVPSPPRPGASRCLVEIAAIPTFMSPFDWRIVAQTSNAFEIHDVNLLDGRFREPEAESDAFWRQTIRYPNIWNADVTRAAQTRLGQVFLGFSRFPAARTARDSAGAVVVRFTDMRFVGGPLISEQPARRVQPFTATIRFAPDGTLASERLGQ
jgi:membrane-bound metal-dependent hydrolase YbcI (DUF457 family)